MIVSHRPMSHFMSQPTREIWQDESFSFIFWTFLGFYFAFDQIDSFISERSFIQSDSWDMRHVFTSNFWWAFLPIWEVPDSWCLLIKSFESFRPIKSVCPVSPDFPLSGSDPRIHGPKVLVINLGPSNF